MPQPVCSKLVPEARLSLCVPVIRRWSGLVDRLIWGNMIGMRTRALTTQIIVMFCLLTLQLQAFAASALPCLHAADESSQSSHGSAMLGAGHCAHQFAATAPLTIAAASDDGFLTVADADGQDSPVPTLAECQKCALELCVFGAMGVFPQAPSLAVADLPIPTPSSERHFYRYSDDLWSKPPIPVLG